jgi:hypothetical protein
MQCVCGETRIASPFGIFNPGDVIHDVPETILESWVETGAAKSVILKRRGQLDEEVAPNLDAKPKKIARTVNPK